MTRAKSSMEDGEYLLENQADIDESEAKFKAEEADLEPIAVSVPSPLELFMSRRREDWVSSLALMEAIARRPLDAPLADPVSGEVIGWVNIVPGEELPRHAYDKGVSITGPRAILAPFSDTGLDRPPWLSTYSFTGLT